MSRAGFRFISFGKEDMTSTRPKIVYILPEFDPDTGSHFFYLYELLRSGVVDPVVIAVRGRGRPDLPFPCRALPFSNSFLRVLGLLWVCLQERLSGRRWFYVHYSFLGALAAWAVTRVMGGRVYYWNAGMPWLYRRPRMGEMLFRFILRHTILVTATDVLKEEYRRRYGLRAERIRVLPNWVTASRFQRDRAQARRELGIRPDALVLLFVHRLSRRKGADLIPAIAAAVTKEHQNAMFLIVGGGPERENLEFIIHNSEFKDHVRFVGEVPNRNIPDYFAAADVFFMPSEEEGFPHVLLEAMAAGLPYVASDVGGVREITPSVLQSYLVPSGDTQRFAERIVALLGVDSRERAAISAAEREWVKRYDISVALQKFKDLLRR